MTGKIIGITIILLLVLSIVATGIGAVASGGSLDPPNASAGPALAQSNVAQVAADDDENALYAAFTYVCPFH